MTQPLSKEAFDLWAEANDRRMDTIAQFMQSQVDINERTAVALAVVKDRDQRDTRRDTERRGWVQNLITAIIAAIMGALSGGIKWH